jgi:predicted DNA-binding transcriptional regulator AlpA
MLIPTGVPITHAALEGLTEPEAAIRLGLKVATLRAWRHRARGPVFVRLGRAIRYLTSDIDEFLRANRHPADSHTDM